MICKKCSEAVPEGASVCPKCGSAIPKPVIISRHSMPKSENPNCVSPDEIYRVTNRAADNAELKRKLRFYLTVILITLGVLSVYTIIRLFLF